MKVGFVVWNPFQVYHMRSIAEHLPNSLFVVVDKGGKGDIRTTFGANIADFIAADFTVVRPGGVPQLDGTLDAMVCPNPIPLMEDLQSTKTFCMQYSMTKERYQYGAWRALFDGHLAYGRYSAERIAPLGPTREVGNPRFDPWFDGTVVPRPGVVDSEKPTVLYLPTWGEFSSVGSFAAQLRDLQGMVNVVVKVHHKTHSHEAAQMEMLRSLGIEAVFGASDDLLELLQLADVVMSDFSGAIFDAIYVRRPVILLQEAPDELIGRKFGPESIEYARRDDIGPIVTDPSDLLPTVRAVLDDCSDYRKRNEGLRAECFAFDERCGEHAAAAICDLLENGEGDARPYQSYLRDYLRETRVQRREMRETISSLNRELRQRNVGGSVPRYAGSPSAIVDRAAGRTLGGIGATILRAGRADLALKFLGRSVLVQPDSALQWARVGDTRARMRHWHKAALAYERSLSYGEVAATRFRLGEALAQSHRWDAAATAMRRAVAEDDTDLEWLYRLADVLERSNRQDEAAEVRERARRRGQRRPGNEGWCPAVGERPPPGALRWDTLAGLLVAPEDKDWPAVQASRRRAVERKPTLAKHHFRLGVADAHMLDWPAAVESYATAVGLKPTVAKWHHRLGKAREVVFDFRGAEAAYREAIILDSTAAPQWDSLGRLYAKRARWQEASRTCLGLMPDGLRRLSTQQQLSDDPGAQRLVRRLRTVLESEGPVGDEAGIAEVLHDAQRIETGLSVEWWFALHWRLMLEGRLRSAYAAKDIAARRAIAQAPGLLTGRSLSTITTVARALAYLGRYEEAIDYLAEAASIHQTHESLHRLGWKLTADLLLAKGETADAVTRLRDVPGTAAPVRLDDLAVLVTGKDVAVVGPAQISLHQGAEIDAFDVVVRSNVFNSLTEDQITAMGTRTDVAYYNSGVRQLGDDLIANQLSSGAIKMAVLRRPVRSAALASHADVGRVRLLPREYRAHYRASCFGIQRIIYDLLPLRPRSVKIFNIDFFVGMSEYEAGYKQSGADISFRGFSHDFRADFILTQTLAADGAVAVDPRVGELLSMTPQGYIDVLEGKH